MLALIVALALAASAAAQNPSCVYTDEELDIVYDFNPLSRLYVPRSPSSDSTHS